MVSSLCLFWFAFCLSLGRGFFADISVIAVPKDSGAVMAGVSLILSLNVPRNPQAGDEVIFGYRGRITKAAE